MLMVAQQPHSVHKSGSIAPVQPSWLHRLKTREIVKDFLFNFQHLGASRMTEVKTLKVKPIIMAACIYTFDSFRSI